MEANHRQPWIRLHALPLLLLVAATFIVYSNSFHNGFHLDDVPELLENAKIKDLRNFKQILTSPRGVSMATFALNYAIGGFNVFGYHLVSVVCHALSAMLLYLLFFHTLQTGRDRTDANAMARSRKLALFAALLFAVHPVQTQAVNYIVQRVEILASLFYLLALLLFIKAAVASGRGRRTLLFCLVFASYWLGLCSKEIAITFPVLALLYDYCFLARGSIRDLVRQRGAVHLGLILLMGFFSARFISTLGGISPAADSAAAMATAATATAGFAVATITPLEYLYTQFNVILYYIVLLFLPLNLNLLYDYPIAKNLWDFPAVSKDAVLNFPPLPPILSLMILLGIIFYALCKMYRSFRGNDIEQRIIPFFIFWFFIILLPTSSIVPITDVIFEHRLYLSSAGFAFLVVFLLDRLLGRKIKAETSAD